MAITVNELQTDEGLRYTYTCDLPHAAPNSGPFPSPFTSAPMLSEEIARICGDTHENTIHGPRVIEVGAHLAWLATEARRFADAESEFDLRDACQECPGTALDPAETDYATIVNAAAGQMEALLGELADAILGRRA